MPAVLRRWWVALAIAVATFNVLAGVGLAISGSDMSASSRGVWVTVMLAGSGAVAWGLTRRAHQQPHAHLLVVLGTLPTLLWFWLVVPAIVAVAVISGALLETRCSPRPPARPVISVTSRMSGGR